MATQERDKQAAHVTELVPTDPQDLAAVGGAKPGAPQGITEEESQEIQSRANDLVKQLEGASGSRELEIIDSMTSLGIHGFLPDLYPNLLSGILSQDLDLLLDLDYLRIQAFLVRSVNRPRQLEAVR